MFSLIDLIKSNYKELEPLETLGILDVGAMLIDGNPKEYGNLVDRGYARVVGFEPVETECNRLNNAYQNTGMKFLPYFIGNGTKQKFHLTNHSMTASLYEPNTNLLNLFQNLGDLTVPVSEEWVDTQRLDDIVELNFPIDFIKMDIQGAELQAFEGAQNRVLKDVLVIQAEAEWVPLYKNQPLFSELELFLRSHGFIVHKIMGFGTRSFKPIVTNNNINAGIQQLWSDVIFVRDFTKLNILTPQQLLKMAVIMHDVYHSLDLAHLVLQEYDRQKQTRLAQAYLARLTGTDVDNKDAEFIEKLKTNPDDFVALYSLGVSAFARKDLIVALNFFEKARIIQPGFAQLYYNLGIITGKLGRSKDALANLDQAIKLDPNYESARNLRNAIAAEIAAIKPAQPLILPSSANREKHGNALELQAKNKLDAAEALFLEILASDPSDLPSLFSLGGIEHNRNQPEKALAYFERALNLKTDFPPLYYNMGIVLQALKQYDKALASYDMALSLNPGYAEVMLNRGGLLVEMKRHKDALLNYEDLLKIDPMNDKALCNRGIILTDFKLNDLAIQTFASLVAISPEYDYALGLLCFAKLHACDWRDLEPLYQAIIEGVRSGKRVCKTLALTAISDDPHDHMLGAQIFAKHFYPAQEPMWRGEIYNHAKIKIAYVSPDFREHPVGHLTAGIFENHDKEKFEVTAISLGIDDRSPLRQRMLAAFDKFVDARAMTSRDIAAMLRSMEVDILIDLAGYTADSRTDIFAFRPAPVQVNYLGYSSTMGADYLDYIIADRHIIPEEYRNCYNEKVVYMPRTYLPTDSAITIAETTPSREHYGLPSTGFVFCSFNHDYKINPPVFDVWMRLLKSIPGSVLWLMKLNESAELNLRKEAAARGVAPERIVFAKRVAGIEEHLARYRLADIFLDTTPCNAHSTSSDVLRAGLPIVTCRGRAFAGRVAAGLLELVNLPELITESLEDYEKLALKLAEDKDLLRNIKLRLEQTLAAKKPFDTVQYCRHLESAYGEMWERCRNGLQPEHFAVPK